MIFMLWRTEQQAVKPHGTDQEVSVSKWLLPGSVRAGDERQASLVCLVAQPWVMGYRTGLGPKCGMPPGLFHMWPLGHYVWPWGRGLRWPGIPLAAEQHGGVAAGERGRVTAWADGSGARGSKLTCSCEEGLCGNCYRDNKMMSKH